MTLTEVQALLEKNKNERGIAHWEKSGRADWSSYGIGLTQLKKIAKQMGRDETLSRKLAQQPNYDMRVLSMLTGTPKKRTADELEAEVNEVDMWSLSHVWTQNVLAGHPAGQELFERWRDSKEEIKRRVAYGWLYGAAKNKKLDDAYFIPIVQHIKENLQQEENLVRDTMNNALFALGQRSKALNEQCIAAAQHIGPVTVDYGDNSCEAVNVLKHLTGDRIQKKFA